MTRSYYFLKGHEPEIKERKNGSKNTNLRSKIGTKRPQGDKTVKLGHDPETRFHESSSREPRTPLFIPSWISVLDKKLFDERDQCLVGGLWYSSGCPVSFTKKTDRSDITNILMIVLCS